MRDSNRKARGVRQEKLEHFPCFPCVPPCPSGSSFWFRSWYGCKFQAEYVTNSERNASPNCDPPGKSHLRPSPQIQLNRQSAKHPNDCPALISTTGQHSQQKHSQQRPIRNRGDSQSDFHHPPSSMQRQHRQSEQQ